MWGWVGLNTGEQFGRLGGRKVSTIAFVILLDLLHEINWLDIYAEKQCPTHRSKRMCLSRDWLGNTVMMHVHIWCLRDVRILLCVSRQKGNISGPYDKYRLQVAGVGGSRMPHRNWATRCAVDHLAQPQVEGRPPDRRPAGHHQPHEGSKVRDTWHVSG